MLIYYYVYIDQNELPLTDDRTNEEMSDCPKLCRLCQHTVKIII